MDTFLGNVIAGVISSALTFLIVWLRRVITLRQKFAGLTGEYSVCLADGTVQGDERVKLDYVKGTLVNTESCLGGRVQWQGQIIMSEEIPALGTGIYQYTDQPGCGLHQVQVNRRDGAVFVHGTSTSIDRNNSFAYQLRRVETKA